MHVCCGPCAVWPLTRLKEDNGISLSALFYNPNIHPHDEFERRKAGAIEVAGLCKTPITVYNDCEQNRWEKFEETRNAEAPIAQVGGNRQVKPESRCQMCYSLRLGFAAKHAKEEGFDAFTTSLLISPYQDHEQIRELGKMYGSEFGVDFYYEDFRPRFREGQRMAREMNIYRQSYCGCIISL